MKNGLYILVILLSFSSCFVDQDNEVVKNQHTQVKKTNISVQQEVTDRYSVEAIFSPEFGWGYQVLNNGELYINQPHIPSIQGNKGFDSKDKAIRTAEYIINKLENNIFPPTVSPEELDSLGVL